MRKRLTTRGKGGYAYYPYCFRDETCGGMGSSEKCDTCGFSEKIVERLAEYEDEEYCCETLLRRVRKHFPDMQLGKNGVPNFCPSELGFEDYSKECAKDENFDCKKCWFRKTEEYDTTRTI